MQSISNWVKCPACEKLFSFGERNDVILYVELENEFGEIIGTGTYRYCSEKCMNVKLDTMGINIPIHEMVQVLKKEQISQSPNRWRVVCKQIEIKIEMTNG